MNDYLSPKEVAAIQEAFERAYLDDRRDIARYGHQDPGELRELFGIPKPFEQSDKSVLPLSKVEVVLEEGRDWQGIIEEYEEGAVNSKGFCELELVGMRRATRDELEAHYRFIHWTPR